MGIFSILKRLDRKRRRQRYEAMEAKFRNMVAELGPGDIAIDCGANVGLYTKQLAQSGATVYAFEPNLIAFEALQHEVGDMDNVHLYNAATTTEPGKHKLYLHRNDAKDPLLFSVSSSLISAKKNVNSNDYVEIDGVVLHEFIKDLGKPVKLLKMDVEGAEIELLNKLLDEGLATSIHAGFVEVHDRKIPSLAKATEALRKRLAAENAEHITLDWR